MARRSSGAVPHHVLLAFSILTTLASAPAIGQVPTQGEFAAQVTGACGAAPQPYDVAALLRRDRTLSRRAQSDSLDRPTTWELACVRARLATTDTPARESYLMPLGSPWRHGVSMLAARLLDDSVEPRVAELLAAVNADPVLAEPTAWTLGYLERAIRAGGGAPLVLRQCSLLAWRLSDQARVRGCATAGLSSGQDSTFHLLALARLAAMAADTAVRLSLSIMLDHDASTTDTSQMYLFVGRDNSTDDLGQGTIAQPGDAGKGHIDPILFTNATTTAGRQRLLRTALHEAAHIYLGRTHPVADSVARIDPGLPTTYRYDDYFKFIHSTNTATSCIRWGT